MLLINKNKNNIVHHFKIFNQYLLSFLLVFTGLNLDEHAHHFDGGYGICNQGCDSTEHHSMHNECEECINNSGKQKFFINIILTSLNDDSNSFYKEAVYSFSKNIGYHSFSTRAPPTSL